ncbi:hypothetical protein VFPFJ_09790 [Purpureocillium lilacinum]|uniref:Uncharacterized protein n=1 Tax=Purpureocillium lilacinum TaxID=33203 RepID=A0A179GN36_PURLI|nr:hypothetical protein VFPFJ_09790 [Purpureocillium lilacinum]OAQ79304.1 hypothetical protein VFPFJ_09790 [Purpureocillium lilacinum]
MPETAPECAPPAVQIPGVLGGARPDTRRATEPAFAGKLGGVAVLQTTGRADGLDAGTRRKSQGLHPQWQKTCSRVGQAPEDPACPERKKRRPLPIIIVIISANQNQTQGSVPKRPPGPYSLQFAHLPANRWGEAWHWGRARGSGWGRNARWTCLQRAAGSTVHNIRERQSTWALSTLPFAHRFQRVQDGGRRPVGGTTTTRCSFAILGRGAAQIAPLADVSGQQSAITACFKVPLGAVRE